MNFFWYKLQRNISRFFSKHTRKELSLIGIFFLVLGIGLGLLLIFHDDNGAILGTTSSQSEWEEGEYYPGTLDTVSSPGDLQIASGAGITWSAETPGFITDTNGYGLWTFDQVLYGGDLTTDGTYIYMITGNRRPYLIRYNPELNTFKMLQEAPTSFYYGASITYYNGMLYAIDGGEGNENGVATAHFYKYTIATDTWSSLADAPDTWGLGSDIESVGNGTIYAVRGVGTGILWSYDVGNDEWNDTLPVVPSSQIYANNGHALEYMPDAYGDPQVCTEGCLFAFRGNNNRQFFRFDVAEGNWYTATEIPATIGGTHYGSSMAYDSVTGGLFAFRGSNTDEFVKYDVGTETWDSDTADTQDAPNTVYQGGALVYLDDYIYGLRGNTTNEFWRYKLDRVTPANSHWESISTPVAIGSDSEDDLMVFVDYNVNYCDDADGCLYLARGSNTTTFWRYEITDQVWTVLEVIPGAVRQGASMCYNGAGRIYVLRGNNTLNLYGFDIDVSLGDGGNWGTLSSMPATHSGSGATGGSINARYGASITCVGTNVFALKGNSSNHFYSFNGTAWSEETITPYTIYYGSGTANNGTDMYALMGYHRGEFYQYDVSESTWVAKDALPTGSYYNGNMIYDGSQYIYALAGVYLDYFWRYDTEENSWSRSSNFPERTNGYNASFAVDLGSKTIYATRGFNTQSLYKANFTPHEYLDSATWISAPIDNTYVSAFTGFTTTETLSGTTSIDYYSRTSTDRVSWSDWDEISGGTIDSPARRYIQIKAVLNSDGVNTPILSDFTINITGDSNPPTNPSVTGYADNTKSVSLTTGNTYYHTTPYFELTGASDSESEVAGYYVRWTTNALDDPAQSEDYYQTGSSYEINTPLTTGNTYYLRVKTKDIADNVSAAVTAFTYTYAGISPASTQSWSVQADFQATGTSYPNVNTTAGTGTNMTLSSVSQGVWMDLPATFDPITSQSAYNDTSLVFDGDDTIYVLRSTNSKTFYKYTISTKEWSALADIGSTATAYNGSVLEYVSGATYCRDDVNDVTGTTKCIYAFPGNGTTEFLRYDIDGTDANSWTVRAVFGGNGVGYGGSLSWNGGNYIYALRGNGSNEFYRYNINTDTGVTPAVIGNTWTTRTNTPQPFQRGAGLVYVPTSTYCSDPSGCLFTMRGNATSQFYLYEMSTNYWTSLPAVPYLVDYGGTAVYNNGYIYATRGNISDDFLRYDILNQQWESLTSMPSTHYYSSSNGMVYDANTDIIYIMRGYNEYSFYSYDARADKWLNTGLPQDQSSNGLYYGGVTYDGGDSLYIIRGNDTTDFYRYTISTGEYERLMNVPSRMYISADILYKNGKVYAAGNYNRDTESKMYIYDVATNMWETGNATPSNLWLGYGANLVDGGDGFIYTARGQSTNVFFRYQINDTGGVWTQVASNIPANVYQGGCAVKAGNYIYQIAAQNTADIFRFRIGDQTWDTINTLTDAPGPIYQGDACAYDGGDLIYVPAGTTSNTNFYVYSISGNSWSTRSTNEFWQYGALTTGPHGVLYGFRGLNTSAMTRYVPSSATTGFEQNGYWISQILNLGDVYDFAGLTINDSLGTNTSLKYETRTCSDAGCETDPDDANWSDWDEVSNTRTLGSTDYYSIDSPTAQFMQLRVSFASDHMYTPTVNDITLSYYVDGTAPNNPDTLTSLNQVGGEAIDSGNWYNYGNPYFEWSGASDNAGGIGIEGYYVYFGPNSLADPEDDGTLQSGVTYTASNLSTNNTYYLKIKTRDYAGNVSSATWSPFTYSLDNVAPARPTNIVASPAVPTATNDFDFSWTAGSDSGGSPTFQYCYMRYFNETTYDASETCIASSSLGVSGLTALSEGTNTFRVRTKDVAGNYSNSGDWETALYRYAVTPPSSTLNVQHGEVVGDAYSHTFSWNEPTTHAFDITAYCYQVNEEPTASFCNNETYGRWTTSSETSGRFLAAFRTPNTQPGTNYFYIVAKDEAGNVDWESDFDCDTGEGCIAFTSSTITPNTPQNFSLADASNRESSTYRLTLGWLEPADNPGSELYKYNIYRSTDGTAYTLRQNLLHSDTQSEYAYTDVSLSNTTTYYYKITAVDLAGAESDYTEAQSLMPEGKFTSAPSLVGTPTITPRIRSAVVSWLTDEPDSHPATSFVQFGLTTSLGSEQGNSELTGEHEITLVDLTPDTTYSAKLKWVDQDGNIGYSPIYSFTTNGAPSAPTDLTVTPGTNTTNNFTFDWEAPIDEGVTIGGYYYSVNNIPNEDNITLVTDSRAPSIAAATQQGTNTFYVIAVDDVGNYNYNNYTSTTFTINTPPPDAPVSISITDSSDRASEDFALTLRWSRITDEALDHYNIYRSDDASTYSVISQTVAPAYLDSGLDSDETYYYKVTGQDNAGAEGEYSSIVSKQPTGRFLVPPEYTSEPEITVTSSTALITWTTDRVSSSFVNYGRTDELGESKGSLDETVIHEVELTGLNPSTQYYYKVQSFDEARDYSLEDALSDEYTFTTSVAPAISEVKVQDIRQTTAFLSWKTSTVSTSTIKYGKTTAYGTEIDDTSTGATTQHVVRLEGLDSESLYHVRIFGTDIEGNELQSDDYVFQTLAFPRIFNLGFESVKEASSATIKVAWETNVETDTIIEFAPEGQPFSEEATSELTTIHELTLSDMQDNTTYQFRAKGRDQYGNTTTSDTQVYETPFDTRPPKVTEVEIETSIQGSGAEATAQIIVSWKTDENSTSQVEYGEGVGGSTYTNKTVEDGTLVNSHVVIISDLTASKSYHLRVVSKDNAGNETKSGDNVTITGRASDSVFDLIIANLQEIFGWMGGLRNLGNLF